MAVNDYSQRTQTNSSIEQANEVSLPYTGNSPIHVDFQFLSGKAVSDGLIAISDSYLYVQIPPGEDELLTWFDSFLSRKQANLSVLSGASRVQYDCVEISLQGTEHTHQTDSSHNLSQKNTGNWVERDDEKITELVDFSRRVLSRSDNFEVLDTRNLGKFSDSLE